MRVVAVGCGHRDLLIPAVGLINGFDGCFGGYLDRFVVGQRRLDWDLLLEEVRFGDRLAGIDAGLSHCCSSFSARSWVFSSCRSMTMAMPARLSPASSRSPMRRSRSRSLAL